MTVVKVDLCIHQSLWMFKVFIVVCGLANPFQCYMLEDLYGPYENLPACQMRLKQIAEIGFESGFFIVTHGRCMKTDELKYFTKFKNKTQNTANG